MVVLVHLLAKSMQRITYDEEIYKLHDDMALSAF
jgi:hypothetical protein